MIYPQKTAIHRAIKGNLQHKYQDITWQWFILRRYLYWWWPIIIWYIAIFWRFIIVTWYIDICTEDCLLSPGILLYSEEKSLSRDILIPILKIAYYCPGYRYLLKMNHCHVISWYLYWSSLLSPGVYSYLLKINRCHVKSWYLFWREPIITQYIAIFWR